MSSVDIYEVNPQSGKDSLTMHRYHRWMVDFVAEALSSKTWTAEDVISWCLGLSLPPMGRDDPPHVHLWNGIQLSADFASVRQQFARRLAAVWPKIISHIQPERSQYLMERESHPGEFLENLWMLMRKLESPVELGPVIRSTVDQYASGKFPWLQSADRIATRESLLVAAIYNQDSDAFVPDWLLMGDERGIESQFECGYEKDGIAGLTMVTYGNVQNQILEICPIATRSWLRWLVDQTKESRYPGLDCHASAVRSFVDCSRDDWRRLLEGVSGPARGYRERFSTSRVFEISPDGSSSF